MVIFEMHLNFTTMITNIANFLLGQREQFCHCSLAEIIMIYGGMLAVVVLAAFMI